MDVQIWSGCRRWTSQSVLDMWTLSELADCVLDLGVLLDSLLSMHQHIARVTINMFFHFRQLSRILDIDARKLLVCALILTRVDYCNSALADLTPLWRHCSEYFTQPLGLSWTYNHGTMSQLHCRH